MPVPGLPYTDEQLFQVINVVLPCWILLILVPTNKLTQTLCLLASFVLCVLYSVLILPIVMKGGSSTFTEMTTLAGVTRIFRHADVVLPCWVHYAVGDLWVGRWIALDGAQRRIPRIIMAPILVAALLLGPLGLGLYFIIRTPFKAAKTKRE